MPDAMAESLFQRGDHVAAIEAAALAAQTSPDRLAEQISLCNRAGFRQRANRLTRQWLVSRDADHGQLIGISHPTRPWVLFESKPDPSDPVTRNSMGMLSILYALHLHGDACEALPSALSDSIFATTDAEYVSTLIWIMSDCQQDQPLASLIAGSPASCREYPSFWIGLANVARRQSTVVAPFRNDELAILYRMALRLEPNHLIACNAAITALQNDGSELERRLKQTSKDIIELQALVNDINISDYPSALVTRLVALQNRSGRYVESLAWQAWLTNLAGGDSERLEAIHQARRAVFQRYPGGYHWDSILGSLDPVDANRIADRVMASLKDEIEGDRSSELAESRKTSEEVVSVTPCRLQDITESSGLDFQWVGKVEDVDRNFRLFEPLGGGVAWVDFDGDGQTDLFFAQASGDPLGPTTLSDKLFRNITRNNVQFVDVSVNANVDDARRSRGYGHSVTAGDWNQDGWDDIVVAGVGGYRLCINQGDGTFVEQSLVVQAGKILASEKRDNRYEITMGVAIADVTDDAIPDLMVVNYVDDPTVFDPIRYSVTGKAVNLPSPLRFRPGTDQVYVQSSDGTIKAIPLDHPSRGLGLVVGDFLGDGSNQIYVANDLMPNQFWARPRANDVAKLAMDSPDSGPHGTAPVVTANPFVDTAIVRGVALGPSGKSLAGMGIAAADFDANGAIDFHVTNFADEWVNLYLQNSSGIFQDRSVAANLASASAPMVGFGCQGFDYDNDRDIDLVVANGHIEDLQSRGVAFRMPTQIFASQGTRFQAIQCEGEDYFANDHLGRAVATGDINQDGRVDVVITHALEPSRIFLNQTITNHHYLAIDLVAIRGERSAVGAKVTVTDSLGNLTFFRVTGDGYLARNEPTIQVGLGANGNPVDIAVLWNDGSREPQRFASVNVDQRIKLIQGETVPWFFHRPSGSVAEPNRYHEEIVPK